MKRIKTFLLTTENREQRFFVDNKEVDAKKYLELLSSTFEFYESTYGLVKDYYEYEEGNKTYQVRTFRYA